MDIELVPLFLLSPILVCVAMSDLRFMRIPNQLVIASLILFAICALFLPYESVVARALVATGVLTVGFAVFALRLFGGGDVKMLSALMLFIPHQTLSTFGLVFSISMLLGVAFIVALRTAPLPVRAHWVSLRSKGTFPMGISIALAGLIHPMILLSSSRLIH